LEFALWDTGLDHDKLFTVEVVIGDRVLGKGGGRRVAAYQHLYQTGELKARVEKARSLLTRCHLCARDCGVNRLNGESGQCRTANEVIVSSFGPHFGEEAPLVGRSGSGTIFFAYCNLHCVFCQNYSISQLGEGSAVDSAELTNMMLSLQAKGCHNINLVSPTHVVPFLLEALEIATGKGLQLPIVYNTGGYDSVATLELLDGVVDIYMPDMKYSEEKVGERFSGVRRYPQVNRAAVKEMHRQVGDLQVDESGVATRGLLVRHLVLPSELAGTEDVVKFLAEEISTSTYLNVMAQYHP
ncbi:unnamed protein product, partial [marine sediment metagenome]